MVVVEEPIIAKLVCAVLQRRGYAARTANLPEAAALIRQPDSEEKILITNAPAAFTEFGDGLRLLYLTSSPDPRIQAAFSNCRVVHKPFDPEELVQAISELSGPPNV